MKNFRDILLQTEFNADDLVRMLDATGDDQKALFERALEVKLAEVGNKVYYRGLVEFSNICSKDCYYCGIRKSNHAVQRYNLDDEQILKAAKFAFDNQYGSFVLQGGEIEGEAFTLRIEKLLRDIKKLSDGKLGITLSLGEQTREVYERWFAAGAHRYLLRIETSDRDLYRKLHPDNARHDFDRRLQCLSDLKASGYQAGTGVMIGLPFQTTRHLANDLLFMQDFDVDMVGMGPYIEHHETPLWEFRNKLLPIRERFSLALRMIATLRILMRDINIAAATALQAIDPLGREKGVKVGANIIMPNITPGKYRNNYKLYENKPCVEEEPEDCVQCLDVRIKLADSEIGYGEWGDSRHFARKARGSF
ncbi:MAG: [FeFe] hydrogenase H-cluster radical SAM maturase HydE [Bacteroidota bacterium]